MADTTRGAIVFDLDGTLVDSVGDLQAALNLVLAAEGAAPVTLEETRGLVGHGLGSLVRSAGEIRGLRPDRQAAMTEAMLEHYQKAPARLTRPYPGAVDCLRALRAAGHPLGLCTNKALAPTMAILRALGLEAYFQTVVGGDSLAQRKPDPAPLIAAFGPLGPPLLYVGDSEVDAETAVAAGVPFALHSEGYRKGAVADLPHAFAFADFAALPGFVQALGRG